jgi:hypothetical protein
MRICLMILDSNIAFSESIIKDKSEKEMLIGFLYDKDKL